MLIKVPWHWPLLSLFQLLFPLVDDDLPGPLFPEPAWVGSLALGVV
jgi:hypothetical protein